ncbi:hypothetical protein IV38_GL001967 [Lactobacillus selangorensis]|uniref:Uncharacterized protein n=1 Tax=Lactobacillus selangorensis TaxID=81857 RepID=A0A0R2FGQ6_9LACO|nr:hypothetical protein [Lactobacillus selangorensis]KRN27752.1 hypothetical protein IV38_GL001967 [Lactobacillus selangorensis]KRN30283.1 hypothetical protein IV40_GL001870 [Lactobacillus selangorensis]
MAYDLKTLETDFPNGYDDEYRQKLVDNFTNLNLYWLTALNNIVADNHYQYGFITDNQKAIKQLQDNLAALVDILGTYGIPLGYDADGNIVDTSQDDYDDDGSL